MAEYSFLNSIVGSCSASNRKVEPLVGIVTTSLSIGFKLKFPSSNTYTINNESIKNLFNSINLKEALERYPRVLDFLKNWLNIENVKYIPHGVDTHFFKFDITKRIPYRILFVGQHLRDFDTFNYCVSKLIELHKNIEVIVVIRKDFNKFV